MALPGAPRPAIRFPAGSWAPGGKRAEFKLSLGELRNLEVDLSPES